MRWLNNVRISTRIMFSFIIVVLFIGFLSAVNIINMHNASSRNFSKYNSDLLVLKSMNEVRNNLQMINVNYYKILYEKDTALYSKRIDEIRKWTDNNSKLMTNISKSINNKEGSNLLEKLNNELGSYKKLYLDLISTIENGNYKEAENRMSEYEKAGVEVNAALEKLIENNAFGDSDSEDTNSKLSIMLVIIALSCLAAIIFGIILSSKVGNSITQIADASEKLAVGDVSSNITSGINGELGNIATALNKVIKNIRELAHEQHKITDAAAHGRLDLRIKADKFKGSYHNIAEETNNMLDSIEKPLKESSEVLKKISVNDFTLSVEGQYKGAFKGMADEINTVNSHLLDIQNQLIKAARGDSSFLKNMKRLSENDKLTPAMYHMLQAIERVLTELNVLTNSFLNGDSKARANINKFEGRYRETLIRVNKMIKAGVEPVREAVLVINEMANGSLNTAVEGDYKGDHARIKDALNGAIAEFYEIISKICAVSRQLSDGASEVVASGNLLSKDAEKELEAIEALGISLGQELAKIKENEVNLNKAVELSLAAKEDAAMMNGQINKVFEVISGVTEDSDYIAKAEDETTAALNKITSGIEQALSEMKGVARYLEQQTMEMEQINESVVQVSNAAKAGMISSEKNISASQEMLSKAEVLKGQVERFKLNELPDYSGENISPEIMKLLRNLNKYQD